MVSVLEDRLGNAASHTCGGPSNGDFHTAEEEEEEDVLLRRVESIGKEDGFPIIPLGIKAEKRRNFPTLF
jgi:hypothetical protein